MINDKWQAYFWRLCLEYGVLHPYYLIQTRAKKRANIREFKPVSKPVNIGREYLAEHIKTYNQEGSEINGFFEQEPVEYLESLLIVIPENVIVEDRREFFEDGKKVEWTNYCECCARPDFGVITYHIFGDGITYFNFLVRDTNLGRIDYFNVQKKLRFKHLEII